MNTNSNVLGSVKKRGCSLGYVSAVDSAGANNLDNSRHVAGTESVSLRPPVSATGATAHFREEFPHFCAGSVGKKVLLKTPPVAEEEIRGPLVNDVSREQVERGVDVAEALGVDKSILPLGARAFGLVEKTPEVLARCLAIPRLGERRR
jgi:hypothetical protein